jgi:ATP-dependent Lon protease
VRSISLAGIETRASTSSSFSCGSFESGKSGAYLGVAVLIALCSALLGRLLKGGLAIVGGLNLGGSVELVHYPIEVMAEGAGMVLLRSRPDVHCGFVGRLSQLGCKRFSNSMPRTH